MSYAKTTGHFVFIQRFGGALAILVAAAALAAPAAAFEVELATANDPVFGNSKDDDLYTAELDLSLQGDGVRITLGERLFTDRARDLRFDETFAAAGFELPSLAGWRAQLEVGALRVGEGLLGQSVQNRIHRLIGSEEVDLAYPDEDSWFPTAELRLGRGLRRRAGLDLAADIEAHAAPGFRNWLRAGLLADRALSAGVTLRAGVGLMANHTESDLLGNRVDDLGPTAEVGIAWRRLFLRLSHNDYGTLNRHLAVGYRAEISGSAGR